MTRQRVKTQTSRTSRYNQKRNRDLDLGDETIHLGKAHARRVGQEEQVIRTTLRRPPLEAKNDTQAAYLGALASGVQTFVMGPAGTGKTFLAVTHAADLYADHLIDKIILTRPNVPAGPTLGLFPGTMEEKIAPWAVPLISALEQRLGKNRVDLALKRKDIEIIPFEVMRGRTFDKAFVILDEAQNTSPLEMKMFLTRIGEGTRIVVNGDIGQRDLPGTSGLAVALRLIGAGVVTANVIEFTIEDVVRSGICAEWVKAFWHDEARERKIAEKLPLIERLQRGAKRGSDYAPET